MFKHILAEAGNINWMAVFALVTFFTIFTISAILVFRKNKDAYRHMAELPLDDQFKTTANDEK